ncbi:MAG: hypothetical protein ACREQK_06580 [Candidatus Binatia bacterium]
MGLAKQEPEKTVEELASRLKRQRSWDMFLVLFPPLLAVSYVVVFIFYAGFLSASGLWAVIGGALAAISVYLFFCRHGRIFSPRYAAALLDAKARAQERFVTLATVNPAGAPAFYDRLRKESAGLLHRIDLRDDFPYRVKRSFAGSIVASLILILAFHVLFQFVFLASPAASPSTELSRAVGELSRQPRFRELARRLEALIAKMERGGLSDQEKAAVIQELIKKMEEEKKQDQTGSDLLDRAEKALRGLEKGEQERREDAKGGGAKTDLPEEGEGKGKSKGGGGEGDDKRQAVLQNEDLKGEKSPREPTKDQSKGQGEGKGQGESMKQQGETKKEIEGTARKEMEGKGSKANSTEPPSGQPPQERFYKPGEGGEKGLKGARYVTVELPEVESSGPGTGEGERKQKAAKSKIPVSNVPLSPATTPDLPGEKQSLPLEYEGLIR